MALGKLLSSAQVNVPYRRHDCLSDEALSRHFSISRQTAMTVRREISARYTVTCQWLDEFKRSALANGFAEHEGRRKYLDGLRSSDIEKKNKAVMSTIRWLLRY